MTHRAMTDDDWIEYIRETQAIRVGMTREELLREFREMGGLCHPKRQTFLYRYSSRILVTVEFKIFDETPDQEGKVGKTVPWRNEEGIGSIFDRRDTVASFTGPYIGSPIWD